MTPEEFTQKVVRSVTRLRRGDDDGFRAHLRTLMQIREQGRRGGSVERMIERAGEVLGGRRAEVDAAYEKAAASRRAEIASVIAAASPVNSSNQLLAEQLRANALVELTPLFAAGKTEALVERLKRLQLQGAILEAFIMAETTATLAEVYPETLPDHRTEPEITFLRGGPPELRVARKEAEELAAIWREQGEAPWAEIVKVRPDRDREAARLLPEGRDLVAEFERVPPPVGFAEGGEAAANATINDDIRSAVAAQRGGSVKLDGGADMNAAIRQAAGRGGDAA